MLAVGSRERVWWTSGPSEDGLPGSNLDVGELSGDEDLLAAISRGIRRGRMENQSPLSLDRRQP